MPWSVIGITMLVVGAVIAAFERPLSTWTAKGRPQDARTFNLRARALVVVVIGLVLLVVGLIRR